MNINSGLEQTIAHHRATSIKGAVSMVKIISARALLSASASTAVFAAVLLQAAPANAQSMQGAGVAVAPDGAAGAPAGSTGSAAAQAAMAERSRAMMQRSANAVVNARRVQEEARIAAAAALAIPNGLKPGGLVVDRGVAAGTVTWQGADGPVERDDGLGTEVYIKQNEAKAILSWESFNVGTATTVRFDQSGGNTEQNPTGAKEWIALNRVSSPDARPSEIHGQIKADGQVYIINRNGILFGATGQVNTRGLVASSLSLTDQQFMAGINNPQRFPMTGGYDIPIPTFGAHSEVNLPMFGTETFDPGEAPAPVEVAAGAQIDVTDGGKLLIFAPQVINAGTLRAPDGQVILAAGENVFLTSAGDPTGTIQTPEVRGLEVAVSAPSPRSIPYNRIDDAIFGTGNANTRAITLELLGMMDARMAEVGYRVENHGVVEVERGNITLQSLDIVQAGVLHATTAMNNRNGSIVLRAWGQGTPIYGAESSQNMRGRGGGTIELAPGSVTQVIPDVTDTEEIETTSLDARYQVGAIRMYGKTVDFQADSSVIVPAGEIEVQVMKDAWYLSNYRNPPSGHDGSRIYVDKGAFLSTAGLLDVSAPMERNFVEVDLRINELRDSPLLRDSWMRGLSVTVDRRKSGMFEDGLFAGVDWIAGSPGEWIGSPIGDMSGWIGVGMTTLAEQSTVGGSITLQTKWGDVITREGALLDISGGSVRFEAGLNTETRLMGADGRIYAISEAPAGQQYVEVSNSFTKDHARWGVTDTWVSPLMSRPHYEAAYTEGQGAGAIQINAGGAFALDSDIWAGVVSGDYAALEPARPGGSLTLGNSALADTIWSPGHIIISADPTRLAADFTVDTVIGEAWYIAERENWEPGPDAETRAEKHTWFSDTQLNQSGLGAINLNVTDDSLIEAGVALDLAPGTRFYLAAVEGSPTDLDVHSSIRIAGGTIDFGMRGGELHLASGAKLDVSGQWRNDWLDGGAGAGPLWRIDGGSIRVQTGALIVDEGAILDVSGGARAAVDYDGRPRMEVGDAGEIWLERVSDVNALDLRGYSAGDGGALRFSVGSDVQLGGERPEDEAGIFWLPGMLFADRGFSSLQVGTTGTIIVPESALVTQEVFGVDLLGDGWRGVASGTAITDAGSVGPVRPELALTQSPTALMLASGAGVLVDSGALVRTGLLGSVQISGSAVSGSTPSDTVTIRGTVESRAGSIDIIANDFLLADGASLLARGEAMIYPNALGLRTGTVLDGGSVRLNAVDYVLESGSRIDVSGAAGEIDLPLGGIGREGTVARAVALASDGGLIRLSGLGLIAGELIGKPGGPGAAGGRLEINFAQRPIEGGGGGGPFDIISQTLVNFDPDCFGGVGNGVCDYSDWREALGVDWGPIFESFGLPVPGAPAILPENLAALLAGGDSNFVVSETAQAPAAGGGALNPADYGLSDEILDFFRDNFFYSDVLRSAFQTPARAEVLVVRPSAFADGGFADLTLTAGMDGQMTDRAMPIKLDGVNLALGRSIILDGPVANGGLADSVLSAPYLKLGGLSGGNVADKSGTLTLRADMIDLSGTIFDLPSTSHITGFTGAVIEAGQVRVGGAGGNVSAGGNASTFIMDGDLTVRAGQLSPGSMIQTTLRAERIRVERLGDRDLPPPPLSAGGSLTLEAPVIEQFGVVRAPHGEIILKASEELVLGDGSVTSASGAGVIAPYGVLTNNEHWRDPTIWQPSETDPAANALIAPPEKRVLLDAPDIAMADGAVIDISGGGDLYAWEFVPGPGGSHDVLTRPGMYAVIPDFGGMAPVAGLESGERIWLGGGGGLEAGWYTLLPARYALLPGAYAVRSTGQTWTGANRSMPQDDGSLMTQGRRGNLFGDTTDALSEMWQILPGDTVRSYTEYNEAFANEYFASDAFKLTRYRATGETIVTPRLPQDGGSVVFAAQRSLVLDGMLKSAAADGGRGGLVDVASERIAIVGGGYDSTDLTDAGFLVLNASDLSSFGAGSLLLGGTRSGDTQGLRLDVVAQEIVLYNDANSALTGPEIMLAASDSITIGNGSVLSATGQAADSGDLLIAPQEAAIWNDNNTPSDPSDDVLVTPARDWGALVSVSNGSAARVFRDGADTTQGGLVSIGEGALLSAEKALLIDATRITEMAPSASLAANAISVAAGRIGIGGGEGLVIDQDALAQFSQAQDLTLRSYSNIDFYESVEMGGANVQALTLDAAGLAGHGDHAVQISADTITLRNSGGTAIAGTGAGTLTLSAATLTLDEGEKQVSGFGSVALEGTVQTLAVGRGALDVGDADLTLNSPIFTASGAADQTLRTTGSLHFAGMEAAADAAGAVDTQASLGARLSLIGGDVRIDGRIAALGGAVTASATAGDLVLGETGAIDVGGFGKRFFDLTEFTDAGAIDLLAVGDVRLEAGSMLNLAAQTLEDGASGGSAGTLSVVAAGGGAVVLDGDINAQAGEGGEAGSFRLAIDRMADFGSFNERLNTAGFTRSRQFQVSQGDVVMDGAIEVQDFLLVAENGRVDVAGMIDARSTYGGAIRIVGGNGVRMTGGAQLLAGAATDYGSGRVTLEAAGGQLDLSGGVIDVSGGSGGDVRLRAARTAGNDGIAVTALGAAVTGARSAVLEGTRSYDASADGTVDSVRDLAVAEANAFAANDSILAGLGSQASAFTLAAGIEIVSDGNLVLNDAWNLRDSFGADHREGTLTMRAGGDLTLLGHLSDGFSTADRSGVLNEGASWNINLVAGADLAATDALAFVPLGDGSIAIGEADAGALVRTGTGDLVVRAAGDLTFGHAESALYTAGERDMTAWDDFSMANPVSAYGVHGGNLDVEVGGSVSAPQTGVRFSQWLLRQGGLSEDMLFTGTSRTQQSSWWVHYGNFQQGMGALGGGNISLRAGGDLTNLVVALPINMRMRGGRTEGEAMTMEMRNGGAMRIDTGGAILGGQYYVARGEGRINAAETGIGHTVSVATGNGSRMFEFDIAPILALGDATMSLRTLGDLRLQTLIDPLMMQSYRYGSEAPLPAGIFDDAAYMSGYTDNTALELVSTGGNVTLHNQALYTWYSGSVDLSGFQPLRELTGQNAGNLYPALTRIAAMNGSLNIQGGMDVVARDLSDLRIVAQRDVLFRNPGFVRQASDNSLHLDPTPSIRLSRALKKMLPSPFMPNGGSGHEFFYYQLRPVLANGIGSYWGTASSAMNVYLLSVSNPEVLPLASDFDPTRIYALGSIENLSVTANEQTWVRAGGDIRGINLAARNIRPGDTTWIDAGNDIIQIPQYGAGTVSVARDINVKGPGQMLMTAGRDVYADRMNIVTLGGYEGFDSDLRPIAAQRILGLPERGADITVMGGLNSEVAYGDFAAAYLDPANVAAMPDYLKTTLEDGQIVPLYLVNGYEDRDGFEKMTRRGLVDYMQEMTGETLDPLEAWEQFQALPALAQQNFLYQVFQLELRDAGQNQLTLDDNENPINGGYNRGYAAIDTLFPGDEWAGNVVGNSLTFRTMNGGDINVLVPGGGLQVAALNLPIGAGEGLITLASGHINVFAHDDVVVNRSRLLSFVPEATRQGSDQIVWSTIGDIDAGRGAKTVRVPSAPLVRTDADANTTMMERSDMSGSGIGTIGDGDVTLVAPGGTVNAGDAGIRVAGNIWVAALQVLNADNIEVEGEAFGLPEPVTVDVGLNLDASNTAAAAAQAAAMATNRNRPARPLTVTVTIEGFGDEPCPSGVCR